MPKNQPMPELAKAREILSKRLSGLQAVALYDAVKGEAIDTSLNHSPSRIRSISSALKELVWVLIGNTAQLFKDYGVFRSIGIQVEGHGVDAPGLNYLLIPVSQTVWFVLIATDKIGDIYFHALWSRKDDLGTWEPIRRTVEKDFSGKKQGGDLSRVSIQQTSDPVIPSAQWEGGRAEAVGRMMTECIPGHRGHAILQVNEKKLLWAGMATRWGPRAGNLADFYLMIVTACERIRTSDIGGSHRRTAMVWISCESNANDETTPKSGSVAISCHELGWLIIEAAGPLEFPRDAKEFSGALFYWAKHPRLAAAMREDATLRDYNSLQKFSGDGKWLVESDVATAQTDRPFIHAIGNWREKLPWRPPLVYADKLEIGEFLGLTDIGTSLIELCEDLARSLADEGRTGTQIDHIEIEGTDGCAIIAIVDESLCLFTASHDRNSSHVTRNVLKARDAIRAGIQQELFAMPDSLPLVGDWEMEFSSLEVLGISEEGLGHLRQLVAKTQWPLWMATSDGQQFALDSQEASYSHILFASRLRDKLGRVVQDLNSLRFKLHVFSKYALGMRIGSISVFTCHTAARSTYCWKGNFPTDSARGFALFAAADAAPDHLLSQMSRIAPVLLDYRKAQGSRTSGVALSSATRAITSVRFFDRRGRPFSVRSENGQFEIERAHSIQTIELSFSSSQHRDVKVELVKSSNKQGIEQSAIVYSCEVKLSGMQCRIGLQNIIAIDPQPPSGHVGLYVRTVGHDGIDDQSPRYDFHRVQSFWERMWELLGGFKSAFGTVFAFIVVVILNKCGLSWDPLLDFLGISREEKDSLRDLLKYLGTIVLFGVLIIIGSYSCSMFRWARSRWR